MKRALYTIADEDFATLLVRAGEVFRSIGIPHMFVGGVAAQTHISNYISKKNNCTLQELVESPSFRLQDHLRATDDIDITIDTREMGGEVEVAKKIISALQEISSQEVYMSPTRNHLVAISLQRSGVKRPVFRLGLDTEASNPDNEASMNLYHGPQDTNERWGSGMMDFEKWHYHTMMENAGETKISYSKNVYLTLKVKSAEDLLATKIARAREKDWSDILSLVRHSIDANMPINYSRVEALLCTLDPKLQVPNQELVNNYNRFNVLIGEED